MRLQQHWINNMHACTEHADTSIQPFARTHACRCQSWARCEGWCAAACAPLAANSILNMSARLLPALHIAFPHVCRIVWRGQQGPLELLSLWQPARFASVCATNQPPAMQPLQGSLLHGTALSGLQPAWPSLQPQRRRPELAPACSTRRPLINVVAPESRSTVPAAGGTSPPPPHQQHAQPPHAGSQQLGQSDGSREGEFLNILRKARPPPRQQRAAPPRRPGSPNSGDGSSGSGSSSSSSRAPASAAAVTGTPATSTPAAAKLAPAAGDSTAAAPAPPPASEAGVGKEDTEVIFRLERRGDGWAEEILPHLVVEQRPLKKKKRAYSRPDPWKASFRAVGLTVVEAVPPCRLYPSCVLPCHALFPQHIHNEEATRLSAAWLLCYQSCWLAARLPGCCLGRHRLHLGTRGGRCRHLA